MAFLIHPEHGATNAGDADLPSLIKAGWLVSNHAYWLSLKGKEFKAPKDEHDTGFEEETPVKNKGGRPRKVV
jgi:hypothetical protein